MALKREIRKIVFGLLSIVLMLTGCQTDNSDIRKAVSNQLKLYPESKLQDIYKSFFQDEFGPGHLIENVAFAREYFDLELEEMVSRGRYTAEPCGAGRNFYRVPLDLVKDGKIPAEDYFNAYLESAQTFKTPDLQSWRKKWNEITIVIEKMDLDIKDYNRDKKALSKWLDDGETIAHHSDTYVKAYDPNYRIMSKAQWEKLKAYYLKS